MKIKQKLEVLASEDLIRVEGGGDILETITEWGTKISKIMTGYWMVEYVAKRL